MRSKIREMRVSQKLSSTELSHRLGTSQSSVIRLEQSEERGSISLESLMRAAEALGCALEYTLVPERTAKETKSYSGLKRSSRKGEKRKGNLSLAMDRFAAEQFLDMKPLDKLRYAFELSDFAMRLRE